MRHYLLMTFLLSCGLFKLFSQDASVENSEQINFSTLTINNLPANSTVMVDDIVKEVNDDNLIHLPLGDVQVQVWNKKYQLYTTVIDSLPNQEYSLDYRKKTSYRTKSLFWLSGGLGVIATGVAIGKVGFNMDDPDSSTGTYMAVSSIPIVATGILMLIPAIVNASKQRRQREMYELKMSRQGQN